MSASVVVDEEIKLSPRTAVLCNVRMVSTEGIRGRVFQLIQAKDYSLKNHFWPYVYL